MRVPHPDAAALLHRRPSERDRRRADGLADLDRQFPGLRFRVVDEQGRLREHMTVWLDGERCRDLTARLGGLDELVLMQALSGG